MKIYESENDQYASFINGLAYAGFLVAIIVAIIFLGNETLFDHTFTYVIIATVAILFFLSGLKRVKEKNIAYLNKLGRRNFEEAYAGGIWWVFPLWSFEQKPHFNLLNESEIIEIREITKDDIPLDIKIKYYWQLKSIEDVDNRSPKYITDKLTHEIGIYIRGRETIELLSDPDIARNILTDYLISAGTNIGISITDVFPNITYGEEYISVARKYQEKYKELKYKLDELFLGPQVESYNMALFERQFANAISNLGLTRNEALNYIKLYKNQVNINDHNYNINIGDFNKIIETILQTIKK